MMKIKDDSIDILDMQRVNRCFISDSNRSLARMAETDEFNVEEQLNYEAEGGEGGEGEVGLPAPCTLHPALCTLHPAPCTLHLTPNTVQGEEEGAEMGDDPELEAIKQRVGITITSITSITVDSFITITTS